VLITQADLNRVLAPAGQTGPPPPDSLAIDSDADL
jgi:hypothetical protein